MNTDWFFLSHRASWAASLIASGARVVVIAKSTGRRSEIEELGAEFVELDLGRESVTPLRALGGTLALWSILRRVRADVVFLVATAAYTLGAPSVLALRRTRFVNVITGSGRALQRRGAGATIVSMALKTTARNKRCVTIFQLRSDLEHFAAHGWVRPSRSTVIPGTGIDTETWAVSRSPAQPKSPITVLFAARLFREKGVYDFVEVANRLRDRVDLRFRIAGSADDGVSTSATQEDVAQWKGSGVVDVLGRVTDMPSLLRSADILVAPSVHPEGTPRALIEACAASIAVVAYRQPGVDFVLADGECGSLVEAGDVDALTNAVLELADSAELRFAVGTRAAQRAKEVFAITKVLHEIYDFLELETVR